MKKCAKCGYENLDEALFCAECGHELSSSSSNSNPRRNISFKQIKNNFKRHPYLHICCLFPMILFAMFTIAHDAQGFIKVFITAFSTFFHNRTPLMLINKFFLNNCNLFIADDKYLPVKSTFVSSGSCILIDQVV